MVHTLANIPPFITKVRPEVEKERRGQQGQRDQEVFEEHQDLRDWMDIQEKSVREALSVLREAPEFLGKH